MIVFTATLQTFKSLHILIKSWLPNLLNKVTNKMLSAVFIFVLLCYFTLLIRCKLVPNFSVNSVCTSCWNEPQNTATSDYCGIWFRLECSPTFTGNRPPSIGFWMDRPNGERIGPLNSSSVLAGSNVSQNILPQKLTPDNSGSRYLCLPYHQGTVSSNNIKSVCSFNNPNLKCEW